MILILITSVSILLLGSAFCSGSEAAIFSVSESKLESILNDGKKSAKRALDVKKDIEKSIGSIVILNNLFNIIGTFVASFIASKAFEGQDVYLALFPALLTFLVILFGEILPKNYGEKFSIKYLLTISPVIQILNLIFTPILWLLSKITNLLFGKRVDNQVSEEEIKVLLERGKKENSIEYDEHHLINNVFSLNDKKAKEVMTPRVKVVFLDANKTLDEQKEMLLNEPHSRLPVFDENHDNVLGFVLAREALSKLAEGKTAIKPTKIMHKLIKVREETKVDSLLFIFQRKNSHIAIVRDDFGGLSGLVTLEDVLEEIVGEIVDETDEYIDLREGLKVPNYS